MKCKIILSAQKGVDSTEEIKRELLVLEDITGMKPNSGVVDGINIAAFEGEFHDFYQRVKDRIMRKIKAYE